MKRCKPIIALADLEKIDQPGSSRLLWTCRGISQPQLWRFPAYSFIIGELNVPKTTYCTKKPVQLHLKHSSKEALKLVIALPCRSSSLLLLLNIVSY